MRKFFSFILFLTVILTFAACNDKKDDGPDNSLGKAVEGTYPIIYTVEGAEGIDPATIFESTATVAKGSDVSAILIVYRGAELQEARSNLTATSMLTIGLPLESILGGISFRNPMLNAQGKEDGLPYTTTVYIGEQAYEKASVRINGSFGNANGGDVSSDPNLYIEFTATVTPERTIENPDPTPIKITASDSRLKAE